MRVALAQVINTVKKVLAKLDEQGVLQPPNEEDAQDHLPSGPMDDRTKVVREILESERKYVQDLEVLQDYQRALAANDVLTQDQIHQIFFNLNALADFQRRFLIGVEANTSQPVEQQRFGYLFLQMVRLRRALSHRETDEDAVRRRTTSRCTRRTAPT